MEKKEYRDMKITKICEICGKGYHPRRNGYQITSRFCSSVCAKKGRKSNW